MNRFINAVLLFVLLPTMGLTIIVGFDMPIEFLKTTGQYMPYKFEAFLVLGLLIAIINIRRSVRRWTGMILANKVQKFVWNVEVSRERVKRVLVYNFMEGLVLLFVGLTLYYVAHEAFIPAVGFAFSAADNFIFSIIGYAKKSWRVGITKKAVVHADRDVNVIYFKGLRKVETHQESIFFTYQNDLNLFFPSDCLSKENELLFFNHLKEQVDINKVFFVNAKK